MQNLRYFDSHCDTVGDIAHRGGNLAVNGDTHIDLLRTRGYAGYVQYFALFNDMEARLAESCATEAEYAEAVRDERRTGRASPALKEAFRQSAGVFLRQMAANSAICAHCRTADDIDAALSAGKCAAVLTVEGGEQLEGVSMDTIVRLGVRAVTLTWNYRNWIGGSNLTGGGLTEEGRQFVRSLQDNGILVDLSHGSEQLFWDVYAMTRAPMIASHSNARALCWHPRNLTDEQFRAICRTGGLAGYNFCHSFTSKNETYTLDDAVDHIEYFLSLGGAKHIGIGGDLDGIGDLPEGFRGIQDVCGIADCMARRGHSVSLIEDIFFGNQYRIAKEYWK